MDLTLKDITSLIAALAAAAIVSMDLNRPYGKKEGEFYASIPVQIVAVFSVLYGALGTKLDISIAATLVWLAIKFH